MKFAISNIAWDPSEDDVVSGIMKEFGIGAVEVAPTKAWAQPISAGADDITVYRSHWNGRGVDVVALQALLFGKPELKVFEPEARAGLLEYLRAISRIGHGLGTGPMVFGSPKNRQRGEMPYDKAFEKAAEFFTELAMIAEEEGAIFVLEPNPPVYGCDFITTAREATDLVQAVDRPGLRLHLDAGIMHLNGEDPAKAIEEGAPYLAHFHISEPELAVIGTRGVDHATIASALKSVGYAGFVSIEMRNGWTSPDTDAVRQAVESAVKFYA